MNQRGPNQRGRNYLTPCKPSPANAGLFALGLWFRSQLVQAETEQWLSEVCGKEIKPAVICKPNSQLTINVYRYGFVTTSGDNDPVKPELDISFRTNQTPELRFNLKEIDLSSALILLSDAKTDDKQVVNSLRLGYQDILKQYQNSFSVQ